MLVSPAILSPADRAEALRLEVQGLEEVLEASL